MGRYINNYGVVFLLAVIVALSGLARAETGNDLQLLAPISLELPTYKKLHTVLDIQSVIGDNIRQMRRLVISPSLQLAVSDYVAIQAGYSNVRRFSNNTSDIAHSFYQSVFVHHRLKAPLAKRKPLYVGHVVTTEQEVLPGRVGVVHRGAYRFQVGKQIFNTPWRLLASNEMVVNLNTVNHESETGIDQNRTFVGIGRCFTLRFCTRTGYQAQWINRPNATNQINHRIFLGAIINTTGPAHLQRWREKR